MTHCAGVSEVAALKGVRGLVGETRQPGFLQGWVVVVVLIVEAPDFVTAREQSFGCCGADESCRCYHQNAHEKSFLKPVLQCNG